MLILLFSIAKRAGNHKGLLILKFMFIKFKDAFVRLKVAFLKDTIFGETAISDLFFTLINKKRKLLTLSIDQNL